MASPRIVVRPLREIAEFRQCERIQEVVWGSAGVSGELLLVTAKHGGLVLGAFRGDRLAGFLYAFLARRRGRLIHWSHLMAVEPGFRDRGLGFRMKLEHRRRALAQGIRSIAWTYDPLQSRNAALNIHRLGAEVREYLPDCYGEFASKIECGLPSDRFVAEWRIASRRVQHRLRGKRPSIPLETLPLANQVEREAGGLAINRRLHLTLVDPRLLVEIPAEPDRMRTLDRDLARRWRLEMRRVFQHYLGKGYRVDDFFSPQESPKRAFYLLVRLAAELRVRRFEL
jgi:predicted GNAT superfamily acetyltransferase